MFDFWDIATSALKGGVSALLGNKGTSQGGKSITDNSNFSTSGTDNKFKAGKTKPAQVIEGTPQYNQGGGIKDAKMPQFDSDFDWDGQSFNTRMYDFLDNKD